MQFEYEKIPKTKKNLKVKEIKTNNLNYTNTLLTRPYETNTNYIKQKQDYHLHPEIKLKTVHSKHFNSKNSILKSRITPHERKLLETPPLPLLEIPQASIGREGLWKKTKVEFPLGENDYGIKQM